MSVDREPVRRKKHPAADLPERPPREPAAAADTNASASESRTAAAPVAAVTTPTATAVTTAAAATTEKLSEQHNVKIRPSTKARLGRGVDQLRVATGDRTISLASVTDKAINEYLDRVLG